ncbi:MAG: 30S ribosomal protein S6 [Pirellulaceae bacterium]
MATNVYECLFLLDSNRYARDPNAVANQISEIVAKCGGEVMVSRLWNEQRLAYPIDGHRKGTYWLAYFKMSSEKQTDFNRMCQLNDSILRNLVLKVDSRLVDTLVAHASGERNANAPAEEEGDEVAEPAGADS